MKRITMKLRTPLQDAEVAKLAMELADKQVEEDADREEWAILCRQHRDKVKASNEIITELAQKVHSKGYESDVECELRPLEKSQRVQVIRLDTMEIVETRPMTAAEKQQEFKFEGINDPEDSKANAKAFLKKKHPNDDPNGDESDERTIAQQISDELMDEESESKAIGEIEASGETFPKKEVKETKIDFPADLDFGAAIKVAQDDAGFYHGFRIASTRAPKASYAVPVYKDGVAYTEYNAMLESVAAAMINRLTTDPKFSTMGVDRTRRITDAIQAFCLPENAESAAAH